MHYLLFQHSTETHLGLNLSHCVNTKAENPQSCMFFFQIMCESGRGWTKRPLLFTFNLYSSFLEINFIILIPRFLGNYRNQLMEEKRQTWKYYEIMEDLSALLFIWCIPWETDKLISSYRCWVSMLLNIKRDGWYIHISQLV